MTMQTLIKYILSPVIVALCSYMTHLLRDNKKITKANAKGTMLLLRRQIINAHDKYCIKGEKMTAFDFDDLEEIHNAYKALDGNGLTDKMWEDIVEIKIER